jgi:hypothetical protein
MPLSILFNQFNSFLGISLLEGSLTGIFFKTGIPLFSGFNFNANVKGFFPLKYDI